ncbi:hypothetical protein XENTR_v10015666 [Xenopus tropicalis]|nr:hypothetical protein XENTR_v10015666 [Xenopus tropicalis]
MLAKIHPFPHLAQAKADNAQLLPFQVAKDTRLDTPQVSSTRRTNWILKQNNQCLVVVIVPDRLGNVLVMLHLFQMMSPQKLPNNHKLHRSPKPQFLSFPPK